MKSDRAVLILAGGMGARLWPLSRESRPKQFIPIDGRTMFTRAYERAKLIADDGRIFVSTLDAYSSFITSSGTGIPQTNILCEPERRNTAPAVALSLVKINEKLGDTVVIITPSDHHIDGDFRRDIENACTAAEKTDRILLTGIVPTRPETGFGYIRPVCPPATGAVAEVLEFCEKPDEKTAQKYIDEGCLWNSGIYIGRISAFIRQFRLHCTDIYDFIENSAPVCDYNKLPAVSIDKGITEKSDELSVLKAGFDWSDIGTFEALNEYILKR